MAEGKKSVLLYCDLIHTIEKMDNETAGEFFKHYLRYINDQNPETNNLLVDITFESVKQNLKRDLKKWEGRAEKSRENGALGGRPKKEPKKPSRLLKNQIGLKKPVTDKVTVTVNVKDKEVVYRQFAHLKITQEEFGKLEVDYTKQQIDTILDRIENYKNNKNYKSLYLTAKNWIGKEFEKKNLNVPNEMPKDPKLIPAWLEERRKQLIKDAQ